MEDVVISIIWLGPLLFLLGIDVAWYLYTRWLRREYAKDLSAWQAAHAVACEQLAEAETTRDTLSGQLKAERREHETTRRKARGWYTAYKSVASQVEASKAG